MIQGTLFQHSLKGHLFVLRAQYTCGFLFGWFWLLFVCLIPFSPLIQQITHWMSTKLWLREIFSSHPNHTGSFIKAKLKESGLTCEMQSAPSLLGSPHFH